MKRIFLAICAFVLVCSLCSCQSTTNEPQQNSVEEGQSTQDANYSFDECDILTFEALDTEDRGDGYFTTKIKVTNNSDLSLKLVSMDIAYRDKDNNVLYLDRLVQYNGGVYPHTSFTQGNFLSQSDVDLSQVASITVDSYWYDLGSPDENGNDHFEINTIAKSIDAICFG
ncbi:MAG: hypothetical protein MR419_07500 [Clostridiales bacterium]|nr:hypothetical protein [Clostridiales bacterium]MDY4172958.1 hypothetical protein [Evtepia sp.]